MKDIKELLLLIISLVTAGVGFITLLQGSTGLVTITLLILGVGLLELSLLYIYLKQVDTRQILGHSEDARKLFAYSEPSRLRALSGIIAVPIITILGFIGWHYYQSQPPNKIIVLVANFEGPGPENYRVTETIIEQLRGAIKKYDDVEVKTLKKAITAQEGSDLAREEGREQKARIVLWGWYGKTKERVIITIYFEVIQKPRGLALNMDKQILNLEVSALESFIIQEQLSEEMSFLTLLTLGLIRYDAEDFQGAITRFNDALNNHRPVQMINAEVIYFYRGTSYAEIGEHDKAIEDWDLAIDLNPNIAEVYHNRGKALKDEGQLDLAIKDFDMAISLKPDFTLPYYSRGIAHALNGEFDLAISDFSRLIEFNPSDANAYYSRGYTYYGKGEYNLAITDFNQAIYIEPTHLLSYFFRGRSYYFLGDKASAKADLIKILELTNDPGINQTIKQQLQEWGLR